MVEEGSLNSVALVLDLLRFPVVVDMGLPKADLGHNRRAVGLLCVPDDSANEGVLQPNINEQRPDTVGKGDSSV